MTAPRKARKSDAEVFAAELGVDGPELDESKASAAQLKEVLDQTRDEAGLEPVDVGPKVSAAKVQELLRQARAEARAEALEEMKAVGTDPNTIDLSSPDTVVIHFLEDGLTAVNPSSPSEVKVWYRGEELVVQKGTPVWDQVKSWITLSEAQQYDKWEQRYFAPGPWPYGSYDVEDPELSAEERRVLEKAERRRIAARAMPMGNSRSKSRQPSNRAPSFLQGAGGG